MHRIFRIIFVFSFIILISKSVWAQSDSIPPSASVNPALINIFNTKIPKEYTISDIQVTGTVSFDKNLIISISGLQVGDKVQIPGTDVFSKAVTKLWNQNLIADVRIFFTKLVGQDLSIEIAVVERPRLAGFDFQGIKKTEAADLKSKVGLVKDRVVTENMLLNAKDAIRKFYFDKGYSNVLVTTTTFIDTGISNTESVTFHIQKGNKVHVNSINFSGNYNITGPKLKKQMKDTKEMSRLTLFPEEIINPYGDTTKNITFKQYLNQLDFLSPSKTLGALDPYFRFKLFSSSKFSMKKYPDDKQKVIDYYNSQGYRDAVIVSDTSTNNLKGDVNLFIKLSEGTKYYFGNITWKGNTKYSDSLLSLILNINKGDVYNADLFNKRLGKEPSPDGGDITSLYMDDGYLFFQLNPIETSVYNDTIDYQIRIQEGPQATIGRVGISGNDKTKDYVIRRELRTVPGEKFSRAEIIRSQRELSQLGFLNPEKITPNVVPHVEDGTVDVNWQVEEKSADQLELSAGWGGNIGLTGTLGVTLNNFSINNILDKKQWEPLPTGDGQKLSARVQSNGKAYRSYNFSFTDPWLGGKKRNSFTVSLYNTRYSNSYNSRGVFCLTCADSSYIKTVGVSVSEGKQLKWPDDYFSFLYSLNFQQYTLHNYSNIFQGINNGNSKVISLKLALARNSAGPNPLFPTSGSNFMLSGQFTLPYSLLGITGTDTVNNRYKLPEFYKVRFNGDYYMPLTRSTGLGSSNKQVILKLSAKYGFLGRYNPNLEISPFERFQLGDAGLSNSFAILGYDIISQRGYPIYTNSNPKINPENITPTEFFTIFNKYTMEMRYPFSTNPSSTIYGLAFFEAANGWYEFKDYNPFQLRRSVGLGMRFFLPMFGLLGFDYGIGLDRIQPGIPIKSAAKFTFMLGQEPE